MNNVPRSFFLHYEVRGIIEAQASRLQVEPSAVLLDMVENWLIERHPLVPYPKNGFAERTHRRGAPLRFTGNPDMVQTSWRLPLERWKVWKDAAYREGLSGISELIDGIFGYRLTSKLKS